MRYLSLVVILGCVSVLSCTKDKQGNTAECAIPLVVPYQPYSDPVWHPNGQLLGFNYTPQSGVYANGTAPCIWYMNAVKQDSAGFYILNRNGSGLKRMTNFYLNTSAWSPDGSWLAFSIPPHIYKMRFNGSSFDTAHILQLTTMGGNFYPSWTANSDSVFFDSNNDAPSGTAFYSIWKMASDGSGKVKLTQPAGEGDGRQPFVGSDGKVYYVGLAQEIYRMNQDGSGKVKYSNNGFGVLRPRYWQGKVFYEGNGIGLIASMGSTGVQLTKPAETYDVSSTGEIVYGNWDYSVNTNDKQKGTLWIMNADGSNKRQLTFNNF